MDSIPGAYIAYHPWLSAIAQATGGGSIVKLGHSGRLGDRLFDSAYTTCWGEGWYYIATFEVATKEEAERIEGRALQIMGESRIDGRELVRLPPSATALDLHSLLTSVAEELSIPGKLAIKPAYEHKPRLAHPQTDPPSAASATDGLCRQLEGLQVAPETGDGAPGASQAASMLEQMRAQLEAAQASASATIAAAQTAAAQTAAAQTTAAQTAAAQTAAAQMEVDGLDLLDFEIVAPANELAGAVVSRPEFVYEERPYQQEAAAACLHELERVGRTTLLMACRCGKTRVAYEVLQRHCISAAAERPFERAPRVLFLVPWLALIRQTVDKLRSYGLESSQILMVGSGGSDPRAGAEAQRAARMTTDLEEIKGRLSETTARPLVVVSTYHSSRLALDALGATNSYSLTVFDECHHVCGSRTPRPGNAVLLSDPARTGARLFMTATPVYRGCEIHMGMHELFGGVAYRYHLRQGIDAGYVNDFEIQLVASSKDAFSRLDRLSNPTPAERVEQKPWRRFLSMVTRFFQPEAAHLASAQPLEDINAHTQEKYMAAQVALAFDHLTATGSKLLVFCRTIAGAERLRDRVADLFAGLASSARRTPELLVASSRTPKDELNAMLQNTFYTPDVPAILFNCKLFQEGIEFPPLNGVFFATPRHSSRDIIQSLCRALTRVPGKPASVVYIPVPPSRAQSPTGGGLGRFETLLPFAEAIYSEDPRFYEHLLDPNKPYPIGWLGVHGTAKQLLHAARRAIRYGVRGPTKSGRNQDRLTKNDRIPWNVAFGELKRTVSLCHRYPKGNDGFVLMMAQDLSANPAAQTSAKVLNFGSWYNWVRREYVRYVQGQASALQPHQVRDLESLEAWATRGVEGPYPTDESIAALQRLLEKTRGKMPPININNGGWIGLDATPLERLSGFLTTISQQDGKTRGASKNRGFTVALEKAQKLDAVFGRWGLRWRKERWYPAAELGAVVAAGKATDHAEAFRVLEASGTPGFLLSKGPDGTGEYAGPQTAIQQAHEAFMKLAAADPNHEYIQRHWPGYPEKHAHMEQIEVWNQGLAPPRHKSVRGKNGAAPHAELIERAPAPS